LYALRSFLLAFRAETIRLFSPRQVKTTTITTMPSISPMAT